MTEPTSIGVLIVDDHPLFRDGVAMLVKKQNDMHVVGEAGNGAEAIDLCQKVRPDVVLMDLQMPHMGGIEAVRAIRSAQPGIKFIMLTTYKGDVQATKAFEAGVSGYLLKDMVRKDLIGIIREVHQGRFVVPPEIAQALASHLTDQALTLREIEVLKFVALGQSNKRVARSLGISEDTIKSHMKSVLTKLGANDRTHAVTLALKRGIIEL
jgi:two-component system, NarL family, response regulator